MLLILVPHYLIARCTFSVDVLAAMLPPSAIQHMFQYLAPRYDLWNRLASFYLDEYWRRTAVSLIPPGSRVLDLCTGTGELVVKMLPRLGAKGQAIGLDFASNMLTVAAQKTDRSQRRRRLRPPICSGMRPRCHFRMTRSTV